MAEKEQIYSPTSACGPAVNRRDPNVRTIALEGLLPHPFTMPPCFVLRDTKHYIQVKVVVLQGTVMDILFYPRLFS